MVEHIHVITARGDRTFWNNDAYDSLRATNYARSELRHGTKTVKITVCNDEGCEPQ